MGAGPVRSARIEDYWRRIYQRDYSVKLSNMKFNNLKSLKGNFVSFQGGLTAVCGLNGTGKSTLLNALATPLQKGNKGDQDFLNIKIADSELDITLEIDKTEKVIRYVDNQIEESIEDDINLTYISTAYEAPSLQKFIIRQQNVEELLETVEAYKLNDDELNTISMILGRTYKSCEIFELEKDGEDYPYFQIQSNHLTYGSEHMGLGELSAFYIFWNLKRLPKNSILIIDEPETYLSYKAQKALVNAIVKYSFEKSIWTIVSTHSLGILNKIPSKYIKLHTC